MRQKIIDIFLDRNKQTDGWKWMSSLELWLQFGNDDSYEEAARELQNMIDEGIAIKKDSINHSIYKLTDEHYK